MKLENTVQTFLGVKEATEDIKIQQCNTTINDQQFQSTFLVFFTHCEQYYITYAELFNHLADTMNICRMACPRLVEEFESSGKVNLALQDEVLFEKHVNFISVTSFPFKFHALITTAIRRYGQLRHDTLHTVTERLLHLLARCNEELRFEDITLLTSSFANAKGEFVIHSGKLSHFVEVFMHHNRDQKYNETFLLMYCIYTSAETIIS